jgi:hypothetical protein
VLYNAKTVPKILLLKMVNYTRKNKHPEHKSEQLFKEVYRSAVVMIGKARYNKSCGNI